MTPEQIKREMEKFEKFFEHEMYLLQFSMVPPKPEIDKVVKKWMQETWLERAKEGQEEMEELKKRIEILETDLNFFRDRDLYGIGKETK